ncbi:MAG: AI-2E family transporter [Anaerolineae bacterium]|nr:AI-2E family transporter [Anaerolineae bacterium]
MSTEPLLGLNQPSPPQYQPQWSLWVRQLLLILLILGTVWLMTLIAPVLPMLTIAFLLAFVMFLPSRTIARNTPIPYALAVILLYMLLITVLIIGMLVIIPTLVSGANSVLNTLEQGYVAFTENLANYDPDDAVIEVFGTRLVFSDIIVAAQSLLVPVLPPEDTTAAEGTTPQGGDGTGTETPSDAAGADSQTGTTRDTLQLPQGELGNLINQFLSVFGSVTQTVTSAIGSVTGFVASLLLAMFISFLVLLDIPNTQRALAARIPVSYQREVALLTRRMMRVWNGFFRGQVLIGVMVGTLTWVQLSVMGIGSAIILAVFTGVISLIPTIGSIIALIPLGLVPLIQGSTVFPAMPYAVLALFVVAVNLLINQIIWNVIAPKILGDALDLPLPLIIVGVFIGAAAGGVLGAFLVAPIMASLRVGVTYLWHKINMEDPFPGEDAPFDWGESMFEKESRRSWRMRLPIRLPKLPPAWANPAGGK